MPSFNGNLNEYWFRACMSLFYQIHHRNNSHKHSQKHPLVHHSHSIQDESTHHSIPVTFPLCPSAPYLHSQQLQKNYPNAHWLHRFLFLRPHAYSLSPNLGWFSLLSLEFPLSLPHTKTLPWFHLLLGSCRRPRTKPLCDRFKAPTKSRYLDDSTKNWKEKNKTKKSENVEKAENQKKRKRFVWYLHPSPHRWSSVPSEASRILISNSDAGLAAAVASYFTKASLVPSLRSCGTE